MAELAVGTGTGYVGQMEVTFDPIIDVNVVTLAFLKKWRTEQTGIPTGAGTLFPNVDVASENSVVYVSGANNGTLTKPVDLSEGGNAQRVIGYLRDGLLYLNGMFVRNMSTSNGTLVVAGVDYWLQNDGTVGPSETSTNNTWSVRIGRGISSGILYVDISVEGLV